MIGQHEQICIPVHRLDALESDAKELVEARALIAALDAEHEALVSEIEKLKADKRKISHAIDATRRHISVSGNPLKKWAVTFVKARLTKEGLI